MSALAPYQFFTFCQNNTGGSFDVDETRGTAHYLIFQAVDAVDANRRALSYGLYFNGSVYGPDCDCCGDRWYAQWDDAAGTPRPEVYGQAPDVAAYEESFAAPGDPVVIVAYASGQRSIYRRPA